MRLEAGSAVSNGRTPCPRPVPLPHHPGALFFMAQLDQSARPSLSAAVLLEPPAAQVMRAGDHARPDRFGHPYLVDEIANLGCDLQQPTGVDAQAPRVMRIEPQRVAIGYFI